jgi:hypothetical protein
MMVHPLGGIDAFRQKPAYCPMPIITFFYICRNGRFVLIGKGLIENTQKQILLTQFHVTYDL